MPLFVALRRGRGRSTTRPARHDCAAACAPSTRRGTCPTRSSRSRAIPATLTGKKMEVPVRRVLLGARPGRRRRPHAMANPQALAAFAEYARTQSDYTL